jgi:hypothetical protein
MFLISLANILPRLASTTAFLCLVVAHLEWPDMAAHDHVEAAERLLVGRAALDRVGEHDHARAGAVRREAVAHRFPDGVEQLEDAGQLAIVVDSPPGMTRPSICASSPGRRTPTVETPHASSMARCSRTSPWRARTPMVRLLGVLTPRF